MSFDPEKIERIEWDSDTEGYWPYPDCEEKLVTVRASDYDKLLELYRALSGHG